MAPKLLVIMPGLQGSVVCEQDELCQGPGRPGVHGAGGRGSSPGGPPRAGHFSPNTHRITKSARSRLRGRRGGSLLSCCRWENGTSG